MSNKLKELVDSINESNTESIEEKKYDGGWKRKGTSIYWSDGSDVIQAGYRPGSDEMYWFRMNGSGVPLVADASEDGIRSLASRDPARGMPELPDDMIADLLKKSKKAAKKARKDK